MINDVVAIVTKTVQFISFLIEAEVLSAIRNKENVNISKSLKYSMSMLHFVNLQLDQVMTCTSSNGYMLPDKYCSHTLTFKQKRRKG